jgi:hypothetical protein
MIKRSCMMLEKLPRRNYSGETTRQYLRAAAQFANHFGKRPDQLGPNELRTYQACLLREPHDLFKRQERSICRQVRFHRNHEPDAQGYPSDPRCRCR